MSSYINFYLKDDEGKFHYLASYSRNTAVYEYGNEYAPYDNGIALTVSKCDEILADIDNELKQYSNRVKETAEKKALIATMNNSVEDKLQAVADIDYELKEIEEIKEQLLAARGVYATFYSIAEEASWSSNKNRAEGYIYAGIEWNPNYNPENNEEGY